MLNVIPDNLASDNPCDSNTITLEVWFLAVNISAVLMCALQASPDALDLLAQTVKLNPNQRPTGKI